MHFKEAPGQEHIIAQLREENRKLAIQNIQLKFALQDAWPYVHGWCTIRSVKRSVEAALFDEARTLL